MPRFRHDPPAELRVGAFRLADAARVGVSRSQLRGKQYSRPLSGVHVAGRIDSIVDVCTAAVLVLPQHAVFSHETALALLGLPVPGRPAERSLLHVTTPPGSTVVRRRGIVGHVRHFDPVDIVEVNSLPVTRASRTFVDLAMRHPRRVLVGIGDAILRAGLAPPDELLAVIDRHTGCRGVRKAKDLLPLLSDKAESPRESELRLLLIDAGLPAPEVNVNIYGPDGEFLARGDLVYRRQRVIVEFDGDQHRTDRAQFTRDVWRGSRLAAAGYLVLRFTALDLRDRPGYVVATVQAALAARS